jgi:hypothetical protein
MSTYYILFSSYPGVLACQTMCVRLHGGTVWTPLTPVEPSRLLLLTLQLRSIRYLCEYSGLKHLLQPNHLKRANSAGTAATGVIVYGSFAIEVTPYTVVWMERISDLQNFPEYNFCNVWPCGHHVFISLLLFCISWSLARFVDKLKVKLSP